jgi:hypothetical protein
MVTAFDLLAGTATALTDIHTIGVLAYQGEAEAIVRWEPAAQDYRTNWLQASESRGAPLNNYEILLGCNCTKTHAK